MAFKTRWECEYCDNVIFAAECPAEDECGCYVEPEIYIHEVMSKEESKARYREAYLLNNFTWGGKNPWMYMDAFNNYPNREEK